VYISFPKRAESKPVFNNKIKNNNIIILRTRLIIPDVFFEILSIKNVSLKCSSLCSTMALPVRVVHIIRYLTSSSTHGKEKPKKYRIIICNRTRIVIMAIKVIHRISDNLLKNLLILLRKTNIRNSSPFLMRSMVTFTYQVNNKECRNIRDIELNPSFYQYYIDKMYY